MLRSIGIDITIVPSQRLVFLGRWRLGHEADLDHIPLAPRENEEHLDLITRQLRRIDTGSYKQFTYTFYD